jgi:hypothetical protein
MAYLGFFLQSLQRLNDNYSGLFGERDEPDADGDSPDPEPQSNSFLAVWGWLYLVDQLAGDDVLKWNSIMKMNVREFLNIIAYRQQRSEYEYQREKSAIENAR